jgi:hypothetical protein
VSSTALCPAEVERFVTLRRPLRCMAGENSGELRGPVGKCEAKRTAQRRDARGEKKGGQGRRLDMG